MLALSLNTVFLTFSLPCNVQLNVKLDAPMKVVDETGLFM